MAAGTVNRIATNVAASAKSRGTALAWHAMTRNVSVPIVHSWWAWAWCGALASRFETGAAGTCPGCAHSSFHGEEFASCRDDDAAPEVVPHGSRMINDARTMTAARRTFAGVRPMLSSGATPGATSTLLLAVIATALPVLLHLVAPALAIATCVLLGLLIASFAAPATIIVLIFSYLFQNLFVALVSPTIDTMEQFNQIRAYNFILTAVIWFAVAYTYWTSRVDFSKGFRDIIDVTTAALCLIGVYFVLGAAQNPQGALVYVRNIAAPFLLFQIFAIVAYRNRMSMSGAMLAMAVVAVAYGYFELFTHDALLSVINGDDYLSWRTKQDRDAGVWVRELQENGRVIRSYLDTLVVDFLNTPFLSGLDLKFYRILGPNFHFISYAYALTFFVIVLTATGRPWFAIITFPLLLIIGSKGALILATIVLCAIVVLRFCSPTVALGTLVALLVAYVLGGIATGIAVQDYHVIGFIGGLKGFVSQPLGRGLGIGGNLSLDMTTINWSKSQQLGHTDVAVESAVGVLLYQMGVFGAGLLAVMAWLALKLWRIYRRTRDRLFAVGACSILTIMANGIFQEEALFSPLALGMILGIAGLLLGRAYRVPETRPRANSPASVVR
jgi:hypothetical protein